MKVLVATTLALLAHQASAHGYLSQPAATFKNGIDTSYNAIITESVDPAFQGKKWNDSPEANTKMFTETFPNSQFETLKAMADTAVADCGNTVLTGTPVDVSSLSSMKWQNDQEQKGFIDSHHGPCEAWIDDTRVFQSDDCRADYTAYPAEIPIDFSKCSGDCTFTFYWLALHEANWQIYKQCAPITNGSGTGTSPSATTAPAATTSAPAATTAAPAAGSDEYDDEYATDAPVATTAAPTTGSDEYDDEYATDAPVATTAAPATGSDEYDDEYATDAPSTDSSEYGDEYDDTEAPAATTEAPTSAGTACKAKRRMTANLRH